MGPTRTQMANANETPPSLRGTASRGIAAGFVQQAARVLLQLASAVVLARLLNADDFGLFAMVTPLVAFLALFQDFGLQSALIQRREVSDAQFNQFYWINLLFGAGVALVLVLAAPLVGWFYNDPRTVPLTMAWAVPTVLGALASQQFAMLTRSFKFVTLAVLDIVCVTAGFIAAVIVALFTHSYWALWVSAVVTNALWVISSTIASGWRPGKPTLRGDSNEILRMGFNITGANVLYFLMRNLDNMLIGRRWGAAPLGLYDRAYKLLLFPLQNVNAPVMRAVAPVLSRMQDDLPRLCRAYLKIAALVCLATVPGMAAALVAPNEVIGLLLGPAWLGAVPIFVWLGIAGLVQPLVNTVSWLLMAQARTEAMLHFSIAAGIVTVCAFVIGLPDGPVGVARAYAMSELFFRLPGSLWLACRKNPITGWDFGQILAPLLAAAGITLLLEDALRGLNMPVLIFLTIDVVISYTLALLFFGALPIGRAALGEAWTAAKQALNARHLRASPEAS